jgi:carbonic anhydrase
MDRLLNGIKEFQLNYYKEQEESFKALASSQSPEALFFSCSDSRVDPNVITQSKPGDLFIVKNVGSIIPDCGPHWKKSCTGAAIEFALAALSVSDIVVCAHSDCGAMKALYKEPEAFKDTPNLLEWVNTAIPAKGGIDAMNDEPTFKKLIEITTKEHIKESLENLKTYPLVAKAMKAGKLNIHGWYYDIGNGSVHTYNNDTDNFDRIAYHHDEQESMRSHAAQISGMAAKSCTHEA